LEEKKKAYLIDGSSFIFRAYYAITHLSNSQGFPTNALYGFTKMLLGLLEQQSGNLFAMVFDVGKDTFRKELYPEYKANRESCPEDLSVQMPFFRDISRSLGMKVFEKEGFEADDIIGTLAKELENCGINSVIVSGDKDLMQLVSDSIRLYDPMRGKDYDAAAVKEKLGVLPEQVTDFLGLCGDSSDNIPGLSGVGPKTAVQLLEKFGSIEAIIDAGDSILEEKEIRSRKKIVERLGEDSEIVRLSKDLATIRLDVDFEIEDAHLPLDELGEENLRTLLALSNPRRDELEELITRFEFHSLFKTFDFEGKAKEPEVHAPCTYQAVLAKDFPAWLEKLSQQKEFAFDLETTSLDPYEAEICGVAFCFNDDEAYYLPFLHPQEEGGFITFSEFQKTCTDVFEDEKIGKIGQNLKFDIQMLACKGMSVRGVSFDTLIASYLLDPDSSAHSLGALSIKFLGRKASEYKEVTKEYANFSEVPLAKAVDYAAEDAHFAWLLRAELTPKLEEAELLQVFNELELPLVSVLAEIERRGMPLDTQFLAAFSDELGAEIEKLQLEIFDMAGGEFNLNSPKQLSEILFEKLEISTKGVKKTKTGFSTDFSVLEKLQHDHPLPEKLLRYRSIHKLRSTYVDALPKQVNPVTGRLHTKLNQAITATGRLSSSEPNLQNIPVSTEEGRRVRKAFCASDGMKLISADYSQIELRVLAHLSGDETLQKAFLDDLDIHAQTAREILSVPDNVEVTPEQRRMGKTINFGIIYGMSGFRLARDLGIPVGLASEYIENYFERFSKVRGFFDTLEEQAETKGFVTTLFGRKRFIKQIDSSGRDKGFIRRAALNAPIQGSAADIIKRAMIDVDSALRSGELKAPMLLQVHDELIFEVKNEDDLESIQLIRRLMENAADLSVPLRVDVRSGANWHEAH
jgi:DNA polymerase-1